MGLIFSCRRTSRQFHFWVKVWWKSVPKVYFRLVNVSAILMSGAPSQSSIIVDTAPFVWEHFCWFSWLLWSLVCGCWVWLWSLDAFAIKTLWNLRQRSSISKINIFWTALNIHVAGLGTELVWKRRFDMRKRLKKLLRIWNLLTSTMITYQISLVAHWLRKLSVNMLAPVSPSMHLIVLLSRTNEIRFIFAYFIEVILVSLHERRCFVLFPHHLNCSLSTIKVKLIVLISVIGNTFVLEAFIGFIDVSRSLTRVSSSRLVKHAWQWKLLS